MPRREDLNGNDIFVIHDFLSPQECQQYIDRSEAHGYGDAPITTSGGPVIVKELRNNDRVMIDDPALASAWFERAKPFLPPNFLYWVPVGLNERFRYYRYIVGQKFDWHFDGAFHRTNGESSKLTFMIYLNGDCIGGETRFNLRKYGGFTGDETSFSVKPEPGKALVFRHDVLHTGAMVLGGKKYVIRSDVMFEMGPRVRKTPEDDTPAED
jgi:hypothetical protein